MAKASGAARARRSACAGCAALARATHKKGSSRSPQQKTRRREVQRATGRAGSRMPHRRTNCPTAGPLHR